ncbi:MAG: ABC transporter substrate-binding protein [Candidatus Omnitrophica bacterium]|nr:ABC transporter substrate-binding protein [Candidatus Omnitrophota bacterium]
MRRFEVIIFLLIAVVIMSGCFCSQKEPKKPIKIGISVWPGYAHAFISQEKGFFKKNGVDVELILKKEQYESLELYRDGGCDGVFSVMPDIVRVNSEGIPTRVVYIVDYSTTGDVIIANPKIDSLTDLKGKTISFEGVNSFSHIFVLESLEKAGIKEADVYFKLVPSHQVLAELEKGSIDAGHTWNPTKTEAIKKGYKIIAYAKEAPDIIIDVLAFNDNIIKQRPDEIKAIVKSLLEARDFIYSNKEEAIKIMGQAEGMSKEAMIDGLDGIIQPDLKANFLDMVGLSGKESRIARSMHFISEFYIKRGQLSQVFTPAEIIAPEFIEELIKEK